MSVGSPTPETLNPPMNGHDSSSPTPETLSPPMNGHDSSSSPTHQNPPPEPPTNGPTEKRKREDEPDTSQDPNPDPNQLPPLWKTSLCSYYRRTNGSCSHGEKCRYAHGEAELRQRPDNTWDPTSERVKKSARKDDEIVDGEGVGGNEVKENADVMMTEAIAVADGEDGSIGEETWLSKCLRNLPMKWSSDNLRCFLKDQGLSFKSAKKKKGMIVGFVNFENSEQAKKAIKDLEGKAVGKKVLTVADVIPRSFEKKTTVALPNSQNIEQSDKAEGASDSSNIPESSNNGEGDGQTLDDLTPGGSVSKGKSVRDVVTPLAHLSYPDQLEHKKHSLKQMLKKLTKNTRKACPDGVTLPEWVVQAKDKGGLPCNFEGIIESPLVDGYRNKCEFSVGYSLQGKPTVGFSLGNFREGVTAIAEPTDCPNISKVACRCAAIFQDFLQSSSLPIWNRLNSAGFWRQLTVREGRMPRKTADVEDSISEVMLMVQVCTAGFDEEVVKSEFKRMAQAFAEGATTDSIQMPLSALVVQDHKGISNAAPADAPLHSLSIPIEEGEGRLEEINDGGEVRIRDHISNLQFCISPTAFFQVNTLAAEKLYALAGDWAGLGPDTLLFDVCCGTGTIGLTLAHRVGMVVGIEMNASAVSDAHRNADINGIKNCRFVCGKAEDVMGSLLKEYLGTSPKEEEIPNSSEKNDVELKTSEEKGNCKDSAVEPENCSALEPEIGENVSGGPKVDGLFPKDGALKDMPTPVQHFKNVVAIVDPPRVGLHPTVTKVLRTHTRLKRLVYISCNPESLVANAIELCTPSVDKTEKGSNKDNRGWRNMSSAGLARHRVKSMPHSEPFKPVKAMAVDLFPHTPHCELVMLLER